MIPARPLILYVEDEADLAALVAELLELEGFAVAVARHGRQALALLDAGLDPRVVVCDMMMPELDGFGFLAGLRERPPPYPPVLAVSAFEPYLALAGPSGAAATLAKPFEPVQLVAEVRRLMAGAPAAPPLRPWPTSPEAERARVDAVIRLGLEGRSPGRRLDAFAARVAKAFGAPLCVVSTVGPDRQYRHACSAGPDPASAGGAPRGDSFCTHAVAARAALVVQDAASNPFFRDNRYVRERGLRFYAGVPLFARQGEAVGTLCLMDTAPKGFDYFDLELLGTLARRVVAELEARPGTDGGAARAAVRGPGDWDEPWDVLGRATFEEAVRIEALRTSGRGWPLSLGIARLDEAGAAAAIERLKAALPGAHLGRLAAAVLGLAAPRVEATELRAAVERTAGVTAAVVEQVERPGVAAALLSEMERRL